MNKVWGEKKEQTHQRKGTDLRGRTWHITDRERLKLRRERLCGTDEVAVVS